MKKILIITAFLGIKTMLYAQLPNIFQNTQKDILKSETVASHPENTFLESITSDNKGNFYYTSLEDGKVYLLDAKGKTLEYASTKAKLAGIIPYNKNEFLLTGWNEEGKSAIFLLDKNKRISEFLLMPEAYFLNGMTRLDKNTFLINDSYKGCIWALNTNTKKADIWLQDELLARVDTTHKFPAANGIKIFMNKAYVSNTDKMLLIEIPINQGKAGKPSVFVEKVNLDDFVIDKKGNIYATTHVYNNLIKITAQKQVSIVAENGLAGSTAVAFGKNEKTLFVTTNGGMSFPPETGLEKSKIIKITL